MKADVYPATALPQLDIPTWVPDVIRQSVDARYVADIDRVYQHAPEVIDYLEWTLEYFVKRALACNTERYLPLACDPRMKGVWRELAKHGPNGGFLYPAIGLDQDAALLELFDTAVMCRKQNYNTTTTQRQAELERDRYLAKANELRSDALVLGVVSSLSQERCQKLGEEWCQKLGDAARAYEDYANEIYAAESAMALERKHDGQARWVALTIGNTFSRLFGKSMRGLTATIASVVLGREIKSGTVTKWLKTVA